MIEERSYKNSQTHCCSGITNTFLFQTHLIVLENRRPCFFYFSSIFHSFVPFAKVSSRHRLRKPNAAVRDSGRSVIVLGHCDL